MKKQICMLACALLGVTALAAQPQQTSSSKRPEAPTAEQMARMKTDRYAKELSLTEKQDKAVYKLYLKQATALTAKSSGAPADRSGMGGGRPGGMGGPGMGGGQHGGMGGGQHGGMGGPGMDGPGMGGGMPQGEMPDMQQRPDTRKAPAEESDKEIAARDKKMKKLLTAEQYGKWSRMEREERDRQIRRQWNEEFRAGASR